MSRETNIERLTERIVQDILANGDEDIWFEDPWKADISGYFEQYTDEEFREMAGQVDPDEINELFVPAYESEPLDDLETDLRRAFRGIKTLILSRLEQSVNGSSGVEV